jgi:protein phosphatase-4 regulatory subunit 3
MLSVGGGPGGPPSKKLPRPPGQQSPVIISLSGSGADDEPSDSVGMDVDLKPIAVPKLTNGTTTPVNGSTSLSGKPTGTYAFAPPEGLSNEEIELRREVIILIQQLCIMGKNVQLPARMALFRSLVDRGVLFGVQWALGLSEKDVSNKPMISAAGEILLALLDHDLNGVRGHVLKQVLAIEKEREAGKKGADKAETILEMGSRIMAQSRDLAVQSQVGEALKVWMDVPPPESAAAPSASNATEASQVKGTHHLVVILLLTSISGSERPQGSSS